MTSQTLRVLELSPAVIQRELLSLWETDLAQLLCLERLNAWQWSTKLPCNLSYHHELGVFSPPSHKFGREQHICIMDVIYTCWAQAVVVPVKLYELMLQMPIVPTSATLPCLSSLYLSHNGEFPTISWQKKRKFRPGFQMVCSACSHNPTVDNCSTIVLLCNIPEGQWGREIHPMDRTLDFEPGCSLKWPGCDNIFIHRLWLILWLNDRDWSK